jgi:hypothetical protein
MSRSRSPENPQPRLSNVNIKSSVEQLFDWSQKQLTSGQNVTSRNTWRLA